MAVTPILLVEDNAVFRRATRAALESGGHSVLEAADGTEALGLARGAAPSLFLIDTTLPDFTTFTTTNNAAVTFTPGAAGHDWLVMAMHRVDTAGTAHQVICRMNRSGEASDTVQSCSQEPEDATTDFIVQALLRVFNLGAASNTFTQDSSEGSGGPNNVRKHSKVFALDLNKFKNHASAFTDSGQSLSTTAFATSIAAPTMDVDVTSDVVLLGNFAFDANAARTCKAKLTFDGQDTMDYVTDSANRDDIWDNTDRPPIYCICLPTSVAPSAGLAIAFNASASGTGCLAEDASVVCFTRELAGVAAPAIVPDGLLLLGVGT